MRYKFNEIAINSVEKRIPTEDDKANYIGLEHLESGSLSVSTWGSAVSLKGEKLVMRKGDVLFGKRNTYLRRASIAPHDGLFSAHGMVLRPKPEVIDPSFFPFFVNSDEFFNSTIRISVGSLSPTVNWKDMKELEFDLPPIEKQRELAELLWAANDLKESYKKLIAATDEMLKAKFREMFGERGEVVCLGELGDWSSGGTPSRRHAEYFEGDINWYSAGELNSVYLPPSIEKITKEAVDCSAAKIWPSGSMLVGMYDTAALKMGILVEPSAANQACACIQPDKSKVDLIWLRYVIEMEKEDILQKKRQGTKQKNLSLAILKEIEVPFASLSLQHAFVEIAQKADETKTALKKSISDLDNVIKGLING